MTISAPGSQANTVSTHLNSTQMAPVGATKNPDTGLMLIEPNPGQALLQTGQTVGLPKPALLSLAPTTMAHLGSLGDNQTSADITEFMALFQKLAQQMRNTARTQRTADMQAQVSALQGAAAQMKDAAQSRFTAAVIQGAMQIGSGLMQAGFSSMAARDGIKSARVEAGAKNQLDMAGTKGMDAGMRKDLMAESRASMAESKILGATAQKYQGYSQASGGIASGLGGIVSAGFTMEADLADARRSELEAQAKVFETGVQHANDTMQQMMDVIRDVRDKLQSMQQSSIEANRGIARNI